MLFRSKSFALPALVTALAALHYEFVDVKRAGFSKMEIEDKKARNQLYPSDNIPEECLLAQRAQINQSEQLPVFLASMWTFSFFVSPLVGGVLGLSWVGLRSLYTRTYRNSKGVPIEKKGLFKYTLPCYIIVSVFSIGTIYSSSRILIDEYKNSNN